MFRSSNLQVCCRTVELLGRPTISAVVPPQIALVATYSSKAPKSLPKYPVPTLRHTISHFVKFARPLQRDTEYHQTLVVANEFLDGGEGEKLQTLLEDRAAKMDNWLTPWLVDKAYLEARAPLPATTSPGVLFPRWNYTGREGQIDAASKLIQAALKFYFKIVSKELPQEKLGKAPLDMGQYKRLFGTTRIPSLGKDQLKFGGTVDPRSCHIAVMRNGHIFRLSVIDSNGRMRGLKQLKKELTKILFPQTERISTLPVGVLTTGNRDEWAKRYAELRESNAEQLNCIEDSLFVVCLDKKPEALQGASELDLQALQCLHGGGSRSNSINRWFDKTLQFIVGTDGYCGVNFEHAPVDAPVIAILMDFICDHFDLNSFEEEDATGTLGETSAVDFTLSESLRKAITGAKKKFDWIASDTEVKVFTFDRFGKNFARQYGMGPDSLIQLALQLAYYRIHREQPRTHQPTLSRQFLDGRTDSIRLPNFQTAMFTFEMTDSEERPSVRELCHMLQIAAQQHKNYFRQALNGQAMDRHLLGLRLIAEEHNLPVPELFKSDAYQKMMHFTLLTNQLPTRHFLAMCYAPSIPDCYAVCYNPQETEIHFTVCTSKSCEKSFSSYRFAREIGDALIDIRSLLLKAEELGRSGR